jgi:hypothetical protein
MKPMEGITSKPNKWTPIANPNKNKINIIQRNGLVSKANSLCLIASVSSSHFKIAQKMSAVNRDDIAYTSPSTAENQNESVKVYDNEPIIPLPKIAIICPFDNILDFFKAIFFDRSVIDQNINNIEAELERAETLFIHTATFSGAAKNEKILPISINNGAPGGWPTSNLYAAVMYSPQSHKLTVSSSVIK